jgi:A/G-specific adenine glycosylase
MLQQTTVQAVVPYYNRWRKDYPDVRALGRAPLKKVLKSWQGLGYYQRARNLHQTAKWVVRENGGRLPADYETLRRLPGFGPYTAAAVASLAFNKPYPVLEANVRRVLMRLLRRRGESDAGQDRYLRPHLESLFSGRHPGTFNQAMMELGALVCRAGHPQCLACPVREHCLAHRHGEQEIIPRPKRTRVRRVEAVVGIISRGGRYLIQKRPNKGLLAGLWEFPGGKVEPGETKEQALRRELREELGVELENAGFLLKVKHAYTQFDVTLYAYACVLGGEPSVQGRDLRWVALGSLGRYPFPSGSAKIVDFLGKQTKIRGK